MDPNSCEYGILVSITELTDLAAAKELRVIRRMSLGSSQLIVSLARSRNKNILEVLKEEGFII